MDKFINFLGIDVSKEYFDVAIILNSDKNNTVHKQFTNDLKGLKEMLKWMKSNKSTSKNTLACMEHTGMYGNIISSFFISEGINHWIEMPLRIIRSLGIQRGKNDKIDAHRIAYYAMINKNEAKIYEAPRKEIDQIRKLFSIREHLIATKAMLEGSSNELKRFEPELAKIFKDNTQASIKGLEADIKNIEKELDTIIKSDEKLSNLFTIITSVPGVGKVTALALIFYTNEFKLFITARQLASYCGVVPFEYTSGKSVRARPRVHYMANKKLKKLLHMCALVSIKSDGELRGYYVRKVEEGKNKLLVINNVRNKIIHRISACVINDRVYDKRKVA